LVFGGGLAPHRRVGFRRWCWAGRRAVGQSSGAFGAVQRRGCSDEHIEPICELRAQARWCDCAVECVGHQLDEPQFSVGGVNEAGA
jgi:hypothetical protein